MPDEGGPPQVSNLKLKLSYWYVSHKIQLRRVLMVFLILLNVGFFGYSIFRAGKILLIDDKVYKENMSNLSQNLIDYNYFHEANKPQDIEILSFDSISLGDGRFDYVVKVRNPNPKQFAKSVFFELLSGGKVIAKKEIFIYPEEEKYMMIFGQELSSATSPTLNIKGVNWLRINDFAGSFAPRLKFDVTNVDFKSARESGLKGSLPISTLNFEVTNNSAYSYWNVGVYMALKGPSSVVGANYVSLDSFLSGETRSIEVRFYENISSVRSVDVLPEVNVLDESIYIPVE